MTTTQTKHTPGPWHVVDNGHYFEIVVPWKGVPNHVDQYCPKICSVSYVDNDEIKGEQNVNLIAAAPDLLEAVTYAVSQVPELGDVPGIRAAIAKATGDN